MSPTTLASGRSFALPINSPADEACAADKKYGLQEISRGKLTPDHECTGGIDCDQDRPDNKPHAPSPSGGFACDCRLPLNHVRRLSTEGATLKSGFRLGAILPLATFWLAACATPRMHSQDELNSASLACGLTYGELIQDDEAKKLLILFRQAPSAEQRRCVYQWARQSHLKLVVVDAINFPEEK
jgi:hypothetical protein